MTCIMLENIDRDQCLQSRLPGELNGHYFGETRRNFKASKVLCYDITDAMLRF